MHVLLCINTFCNGLNGSQHTLNHQNLQTSFVSTLILHRQQLSVWMASKLSTILDSLQQQLLLLNELVARVATLPPANDSHWSTVSSELLQFQSDITVHIAIIQLLQSRTTQDVQSLAELDAFAQTLQAGGKTLEALQVELSTTSSGESTKDKSSPDPTSPHTESAITAQHVGQLGPSLRAAMAPLFLSWSLGDTTTTPLPIDKSNDLETPALREAFLRRPFALTSADVSSLVSSLGNPDPKSAIEVISAQISDLAKEWIAKQAATEVAIETSMFIHLWCGNTWSLLRDMQGHLLLPTPEPVPPKEDVLVVAKALVGARIRQYASNRTSIAFIGSSACGKSSLPKKDENTLVRRPNMVSPWEIVMLCACIIGWYT
jgi:hypothetical protein